MCVQHWRPSALSTAMLIGWVVTGVSLIASEQVRRDYNTWLSTQTGPARDLFGFGTAVSADDETLRPEFDADGIHLNAAGYAAQVAAINRPITSPSRYA